MKIHNTGGTGDTDLTNLTVCPQYAKAPKNGVIHIRKSTKTKLIDICLKSGLATEVISNVRWKGSHIRNVCQYF